MTPSEYAEEQCRLAAALLQQAELSQEGEWMVDAIGCYDAAMEADPELLEPYMALAYLWMHHGEPELARPFLDRAMELSPFDDQVQDLWSELTQMTE